MTTAPASQASTRARTRGLTAAAVLLWLAVLVLGSQGGPAGLATWLGAPAGAPAPVLELSLEERTVTGTGTAGAVTLNYALTGSDLGERTVTVTAGTGDDGPLTGTEEQLPSSALPASRTVRVQVDCGQRTRVTIRASAPGTKTAEVFTWVVPVTSAPDVTRSEQAGAACQLI